jgi:hypothetical protein
VHRIARDRLVLGTAVLQASGSFPTSSINVDLSKPLVKSLNYSILAKY